MKQMNVIKMMIAGLLVVVASMHMSVSWAGKNPNTTTTNQVYDTSFAVEFSYSCLSGGCHEQNQQLVNDYSKSFMTHAMVKCNACHGTHTADELGQDKPNLTGYYPGIGATGYTVGMDRCKVCHSNVHTKGEKSTRQCVQCHAPHVFPAR